MKTRLDIQWGGRGHGKRAAMERTVELIAAVGGHVHVLAVEGDRCIGGTCDLAAPKRGLSLDAPPPVV